MLPVLGREIVEGEQRRAILDQALDRLVVFDAPGLDEGIERRERILLGLGHPDLLQRSLGLKLLALRQLVEDIGGLVHPAALPACVLVRPSLLEPPDGRGREPTAVLAKQRDERLFEVAGGDALEVKEWD